MLALQRWIHTSTRGRPLALAPASGPRRLVAALAQRLVVTNLAHVDQTLEGILSDDRTFTDHVQALAEVLRGEADEGVLPEPAVRLLADLPLLALAVDEATGAAEDAAMMGTASPWQPTLRMRATATYDQDGPPPEVMDLIAAYQKVPLALLLLVYLKNHQPDAPDALLVELARLVREGHLARLAHLAALGCQVPDELVSADRRLDLEVIYAEHDAWKASLRQQARDFAAQRLAARSTP